MAKKKADEPAKIVHVAAPHGTDGLQRCERCGRTLYQGPPEGAFQVQAILEKVGPDGSPQFAIYTGLEEGEACEAPAA